MNFPDMVKWVKDNTPVMTLDPMYITETPNMFMVSRPVGTPDSLDAYLTLMLNGHFVTLSVFPDKPQDQEFVKGLDKDQKNQLKGMFPGVKMNYLVNEASEKSKVIFDTKLEDAVAFLEQHMKDFVWTLPVKERKRK